MDALKDTALVFPFILLIYILIEFLESGTTAVKARKLLQGRLAPLFGSATGIIPQCGFSVMAAKLYDEGLIRTGTIISVFIATSDEALIILLANSAQSAQAAQSILPLIAVKLVVATLAGYAVNAIVRDRINETRPLYSQKGEVHSYSCGHDHEGHSAAELYLLHPLLHALKITAYILIVNLVFGIVIDAVGEENISASLVGGAYLQPFITAAVGLIPNCASSTVITETFVNGGITFGSCVAGLCTNAGLGMVVLLKNGKKLKRNLFLIITVYAIAVLCGVAINAVQIALGL